jgi:hypothetical protein
MSPEKGKHDDPRQNRLNLRKHAAI